MWYYCLGGCSALFMCARRSRPLPVPVLASLLGLLPSLASLAVRVAGCPLWVSLPFACRYAIPCGLCILLAQSGCPSGLRHVSVGCGDALVLPRRSRLSPPRQVGVARALRALLVQGAGRAIPGGSCPSAFPAPVPCSAYLALWGVVQSLRPFGWLVLLAPLRAGRPLRAGCARCGGGRRAPGGCASCKDVRRPGLCAPPGPIARSWGVRPGPATYWLWVQGGVGVGTRHQLHSARTCELALRAVGAATGRLGGAPFAWVWGVQGWALSLARRPVLGACGLGPLPTGCGCGGCGRGNPSPTP